MWLTKLFGLLLFIGLVFGSEGLVGFILLFVAFYLSTVILYPIYKLIY